MNPLLFKSLELSFNLAINWNICNSSFSTSPMPFCKYLLTNEDDVVSVKDPERTRSTRSPTITTTLWPELLGNLLLLCLLLL